MAMSLAVIITAVVVIAVGVVIVVGVVIAVVAGFTIDVTISIVVRHFGTRHCCARCFLRLSK